MDDWEGFAYGVASSAEIAGLTGREILQRIVGGLLPNPPTCRPLTFRLVEVGDGFAAFAGDPGPHLLNPMGVVHGGWALTLIDSACGCAGMSVLAEGRAYTTVETKGNLARAISASEGPVRCEGRVLTQGRRILTCAATLTDGSGRILAHGTSTLMVVEAPR